MQISKTPLRTGGLSPLLNSNKLLVVRPLPELSRTLEILEDLDQLASIICSLVYTDLQWSGLSALSPFISLIVFTLNNKKEHI